MDPENPDSALKISRKVFKELPNSLSLLRDKITHEWKLFIHTHTTPETKRENIIGMGGEKKFKELIPLDISVGKTVVGMWLMGGVQPARECIRQIGLHRLFRGVGTPVVHSLHNYKNVNAQGYTAHKVDLIMKGYSLDGGAIVKGEEMNPEGYQVLMKKVMIQITTALVRMISLGYCHLDIKPENFFISLLKDEETTDIEATLGDFRTVFNFNEKNVKELYSYESTERYLPPEASDYFGIRDEIVDVQKKYKVSDSDFIIARDIYALGISFYEMYNKVDIADPINRANLDVFVTNEPSDKKSIDHLIWEMIRPEPRERPKPIDILIHLNT